MSFSLPLGPPVHWHPFLHNKRSGTPIHGGYRSLGERDGHMAVWHHPRFTGPPFFFQKERTSPVHGTRPLFPLESGGRRPHGSSPLISSDFLWNHYHVEVANRYVDRLEIIWQQQLQKVLQNTLCFMKCMRKSTTKHRIQQLQLWRKLKYEYDEAHEMVGAITVPVSRGVGPNFCS